jgi:excisionase family DNA binding protein
VGNYIDAETIAEDIGVTAKTVRDWLRTGEIVGIKVGNSWRIHRADFDRYIEGQRLTALLQKARSKHPNIDWVQGQCTECGEYMATPVEGSRAWVCSPSCKTIHDNKWATILDRSTDDFVYNCASVIPYF